MIDTDSLLPWQRQDWRQLAAYIARQRVPQALLLTGNKGLGIEVLAHQFALALLCSEPLSDGLGCGHCHSCQLIKAHTHPDLMHITPDEPGKAITIGKIRDSLVKLSLKPQYDNYRVVIINPADQLNTAAANAFLKFLEEPGERTVLLLLTDRPGKLPATIRSRCQKLAVASPDEKVVIQWLQAQNITDDAEVLLRLAQGAPLQVLEYAQNDTLPLRQKCFEQWQAVADHQLHPVMVAEEWCKHSPSLLLFWVVGWVTDLVKCIYRTPRPGLHNPDLFHFLQNRAQGLELKLLYSLYDVVVLNRSRLDTQLNKQLMFEEVLIHWSTLNRQ
ncbi:MAG: DNA polymerase III subunit delta' [Gammaproteobacteria bacterium HGW-Gammaproteobacteria-3]|nr:MAG: DNA polymerase III subunit delta' [Gammaproteobacteria bacterium HGW-Gammaproteobacteria-3]